MSPDETLGETQAGVDVSTGPRRPYWAVGLVLLAVVIVVLTAAFLLDRQLRPRVGIEATATTPALAQAATPPTAALSPTVPAAATPAAPAAAVPTVAASPTGLPVASSPLEREIEEAYLRYWDVLTQAYLNLDTSRLSEVMSGAELARQEQQIRDLKAQGRAAKLEAQHRIAFVQVSADHAVIYDEYLNRSIFVDPVTKQELPTKEPPATEKISFEMRKINGNWKVVDGARHD